MRKIVALITATCFVAACAPDITAAKDHCIYEGDTIGYIAAVENGKITKCQPWLALGTDCGFRKAPPKQEPCIVGSTVG